MSEKMFVAKDLAELLRKIGFNEYCFGYNNRGRKKIHFEYNCFNKMKDMNRLSRPTYDQVVNWISSRYSIEVVAHFIMEKNWIVVLHHPNGFIQNLPFQCSSRFSALSYGIEEILKTA